MYLAHFGLEQKPFQISPDPKFLWLGETHKEALATLEYGLSDNRGFLLLAGDVGTGKTTLINELLDNLDENTLVATIPDPGVEKLDFYNFLIHAFDMEKTFTSKGDFLVHFIHFLHKSHAEGKKVLIIIDEAQGLSHELLEEIRQLSNIEKKDTKLLNIFLVGQHEIIDSLNETRNRALLHRITTKFLLGPLKKTDVKNYIEFRLKVAGTEKKIFTTGAIRQIVSFTHGYPRLINILCDHALLTAFVKGKQKVDAGIVKNCANDLEIKYTPAEDENEAAPRNFFQHPFIKIFTYSLLIIFMLLGFLYLFYPSGANVFQYVPFMSKSQPLKNTVSRSAERDTSKQSMQAPANQSAASEPTPIQSSEKLTSQTVSNGKQETASAAGTPIQKTAPPFERKIYTIRFAINSNEFSPDTYALLDQIVDTLSRYKDLKIVIRGHTDSIGNYEYNKRLSEFRANMVKSYFVGLGVDPALIAAVGMGPDDPIADNKTIEGRRANRRVEIILIRNS